MNSKFRNKLYWFAHKLLVPPIIRLLKKANTSVFIPDQLSFIISELSDIELAEGVQLSAFTHIIVDNRYSCK